MTLKELKKLAFACRHAGISHFKNNEVEFTLTDSPPESNYKKKQKETTLNKDSVIQGSIETDSLTEEQLLMYSAIDPTEGLVSNTDQ